MANTPAAEGRDATFNRLPEPGIQFSNADFEFGEQLGKRFHALRDLAPKLLLRGFRHVGSL